MAFQRVTLYQLSKLDLSDNLVSFTEQQTTLGVVDITYKGLNTFYQVEEGNDRKLLHGSEIKGITGDWMDRCARKQHQIGFLFSSQLAREKRIQEAKGVKMGS